MPLMDATLSDGVKTFLLLQYIPLFIFVSRLNFPKSIFLNVQLDLPRVCLTK